MKIHQRDGEKIVAACDKKLIGIILDDGKYYLDLDNHASFYKGEICSEEELEQALTKFSSANLVGEKAVGVAIRKNLVSKNDVPLIKNFPFIQLYRI